MVITSFLDPQSNNTDKQANDNTHKYSNLTGQYVLCQFIQFDQNNLGILEQLSL